MRLLITLFIMLSFLLKKLNFQKNFALLLFLSNLLFATIYAQPYFNRFINESTAMIHGEVVDRIALEIQSPSSGRSQIITRYTVRDLDSPSSNTISIDSLGGEYQGMGFHVPGSPHFTVGQIFYAFLEDAGGSGQFKIKSMELGLLEVENGLVRLEKFRTSPDHPDDRPNNRPWATLKAQFENRNSSPSPLPKAREHSKELPLKTMTAHESIPEAPLEASTIPQNSKSTRSVILLVCIVFLAIYAMRRFNQN